MQGLLITGTGWTVPELDATPWPDVMDLIDYWADHPPVHQLLAGFMGVKPKNRKAQSGAIKATADETRGIVNLLNGM